jgi:hypothetical protein
MKKLALILCLLAVFAFIATGCGNDTTVVTDDGTTVTTNEDDGNVTVTSEDESGSATYTAGENVKLPPSWPEDEMPVYPKSELVYAMQYDSEGDAGVAIALGTNDAIEDVVAYYTDQLADAINTSTVQMEGIYMLSGEKNGIAYSIVVSNDKESGWSGSQDYLTYAILTLYTLE